MFKSVVDFNGETRNVSFFEDDTVGVVRQQIAKSVDIHPCFWVYRAPKDN